MFGLETVCALLVFILMFKFNARLEDKHEQAITKHEHHLRKLGIRGHMRDELLDNMAEDLRKRRLHIMLIIFALLVAAVTYSGYLRLSLE